jgi:hypothetical protein
MMGVSTWYALTTFISTTWSSVCQRSRERRSCVYRQSARPDTPESGLSVVERLDNPEASKKSHARGLEPAGEAGFDRRL